MLYCNPIFNQYIISKTTDCGKKKEVLFILLISMMHASCPRGKEGKLIYGQSIFLFIFQLFFFYQMELISSGDRHLAKWKQMWAQCLLCLRGPAPI